MATFEGKTLKNRMTNELQRIQKLIGSDEAFYLVALHAFIELYIKAHFPEYQARFSSNFTDNLRRYKTYLLNNGKTAGIDVIDAIRREHTLVQQIIHDFIRLDAEEARAATSNFMRFCNLTGISEGQSDLLQEIQDALHLWDEKTSRLEDYEELRNVKWQLFELKQENKDLVARLGEYTEARERVMTLEAQLKILESRLAAGKDPSKAAHGLRERQEAQLRKERGEVKEELQEKIKDLEKMARVRDYLTNLKRLTNYTRTRSDYEKQVLSLSGEQTEALERISLSTDFLIQGPAGTGKTLVLLKALQKAVVQRETQGSLWEEGDDLHNNSILLLSYTKTLVKYNKYLAALLDIHSGGKDGIDTADSFIYQILTHFYPGSEVSFGILQELVSAILHQGGYTISLTPQQLTSEIEDFIYGNMISRKEYCEENIPRRGMGFNMAREDRSHVWELKESAEEQMKSLGKFSRGFAHTLICGAIEQQGLPDEFTFGYVFVDESQDLRPVDLWILKNSTRRHIILAGDIDQTIYGITQPYTKAGIDIQGKSRILKQNHRSTTPILTLAEKFRVSVNRDHDSERKHFLNGFREGPVPELFIEMKEAKLLQYLYSKLEILVTHLQYEPGNINILVPTRKLISAVQTYLEDRGVPTIQFSDTNFSFIDTSAVRISTLHSAKGLDMPVVMLFIPYWPFGTGTSYTPAAQTKLSNNLLYVAMSRAMDILDLFITKELSQDPPIRELLDVYNSEFVKKNPPDKK